MEGIIRQLTSLGISEPSRLESAQSILLEEKSTNANRTSSLKSLLADPSTASEGLFCRFHALESKAETLISWRRIDSIREVLWAAADERARIKLRKREEALTASPSGLSLTKNTSGSKAEYTSGKSTNAPTSSRQMDAELKARVLQVSSLLYL